ncbi:MAG TPA: protein phosphatase 2C domain-containing protein [Kofleriaceae bacterium]|nr:protein phosphatase 2C domain-containing protein [Kofleriaceae bacterium]
MTLEAWLVTDVGIVREHNEDSAYMEPSKGFFIVADGMGGHAAGEVASAMAVETVRRTLESSGSEIDTFKRAPTDAGRRSIVQLLQSAVLSAHQAVFQRGQHEADKTGMGTTLDVVLIAGPEAFVAHVGDSRTYLVRDGRSSQITTDHTVAEVLVIEGKLTIEEAQISPLRTILVNAIGVSADVGVEMAHVTLKRGDRLLLCSDGLHDYFPTEEEIAQKLSTDTPGDALKDMVELAKTRGGHDNITGVAVQVTDVFEAVPAHIESDVTHPGEMPSGNNPFAADEPTETATFEQGGTLPRIASIASGVASQVKTTQPMRVFVGNEPRSGADTTLRDDGPPEFEPATMAAMSVGDTIPHEAPGTEAHAGATPEATIEATIEATSAPQRDAGSSDTIETVRDAQSKVSGGTPAPSADATSTGDPAHAADAAARADADAAPVEVATADTGPVSVSRNDKGAG